MSCLVMDYSAVAGPPATRSVSRCCLAVFSQNNDLHLCTVGLIDLPAKKRPQISINNLCTW